jgi:hypothetical protein
MSTKRLITPITTPIVADSRGTKVTSPCPSIAQSTSRLKRNVATKVPSTNWLPRSRMKLRSRRGPNCEDARVSATMVMENTTPVTVIIEPATTLTTARAPSTPMSETQGQSS